MDSLVKIKWDFIVMDTTSAFHAIERYFKLVEEQIASVKNDDWERIQALPIPEDEESYQTEYQPEIGIHEYEFKKTLPRVTSYSFVLMLYSEFEYRIKQLCREIKKREKIPVKLNDFKGNLTNQIKLFLKVASKKPLKDEEYKTIRTLSVVRNCIVHHDGFLEHFGDPQLLETIANEQLYVTFEESLKERL